MLGFSIEAASAVELPVCVNKKTGAWRPVANAAKCNAKKENVISINSVGQQGIVGLEGSAGPQGPAGVPGDVGPQGPAGVPGNIGSQGPAGAQGATGPSGAVGPQGPAGPNGTSGSGLSVYDANNQFLGIGVELSGSRQLIFIPTLSAIITIRGHTSTIDQYDVYDPACSTAALNDFNGCDSSGLTNAGKAYSELKWARIETDDQGIEISRQELNIVTLHDNFDCTGQSYPASEVYLNNRYSDNLVSSAIYQGVGTAAGKYYVQKTKTLGNSLYLSSMRLSDDSCEETYYYDSSTIKPIFELNEVTLPFSLPIAYPLRIE